MRRVKQPPGGVCDFFARSVHWVIGSSVCNPVSGLMDINFPPRLIDPRLLSESSNFEECCFASCVQVSLKY